MSKAYPNYQNLNHCDYIQFVRGNENFFQKIREVKPVVDDGCPESVYYMKQSGKINKIFTQMEHEKEILKQNKTLFKKLANTLSRRSSSNYLSNPYPTKLHIESKNFLEDFSKKKQDKKNYEENYFLDKKIKNSKSIYQLEGLEKDFERILSYKKLISNKNSLILESLSPSRSRTGMNFFLSKKSTKANVLPKLSKVNILDPKIKTTSINFFKNKNAYELSSKNTLLLSGKNSLIKNSKESNLNENNNHSDRNESISDKLLKKDSVKDAITANLASQSSKNLENFNKEILEDLPNIHKNIEEIDNNKNDNNLMMKYNESEQIEKQTKLDFEEEEEEEKDKTNHISNINNSKKDLHIQTATKTIEDIKTNAHQESNRDLNIEENNENLEELNLNIDRLFNENEIEHNGSLKTDNKNTRIQNNSNVILKPKGSAKTLCNAPKENSFFNTKETPSNSNKINRTYLFSAKNRIVIDSDKTVHDKIILQTEKQLEEVFSDENQNINNEEKEALEKMRKLEEMELNDDLSNEEKKFSSNQNSEFDENFDIQKEVDNKNEVIITATKSLIDNQTHDSRLQSIENSHLLKLQGDQVNFNENVMTKDANSLQNSFLKIPDKNSENNIQITNKDIKSNDLSDKKNKNKEVDHSQNKEAEIQAKEEEIKNNSNENISNYFAATNQNFYSSAINFNKNINNNFYLTKNNILGFDKTVSSNNIFSLTTVNNFNSNNVNNNINNLKSIYNQNQLHEVENINNFGNLNDNYPPSPIPKINQSPNPISKYTSKSVSKNKFNPSPTNKRYQPPNPINKSKQILFLKKPQNKSKFPVKAKNEKKEEKQFFSEMNEEENIKNNIKTVLYKAKAFMDKLNLVEVTVYMRNKKLFVEVNPISLLVEKIFILCFERKEDRSMISKVFKDYQSFVNNLYYDFPKIEVKTKHPMNYISNCYLKEDLKKIEEERNKVMLLN